MSVLDQSSDSYRLLMRYINSGLADKQKSDRKYNLTNIYQVGDTARSKDDPALFKNLH